MYELTDFLVNVLQGQRVCRRRFSGHITYHDSCCGLRELGVKRQPRALLAHAAGRAPDRDGGCEQCCGFGGTFSIKFGDMSGAIVDEKCRNVRATGADAVVLGDLGCMLNIEGRLRRTGDTTTRVLHIAQVLAGDVGLTPSPMQTQSMHFKARAGQKLADARLQKNLKKLSEKFVTARAAAITEIDDFEGTRNAAVERRNRALGAAGSVARDLRAQRACARRRRCCTRSRRRKRRG